MGAKESMEGNDRYLAQSQRLAACRIPDGHNGFQKPLQKLPDTVPSAMTTASAQNALK